MDGLMSLRRMRAVMIISIRRFVEKFFCALFCFFFWGRRSLLLGGFLGEGWGKSRGCSVTFCWGAVRCFICDSVVYEGGGGRRARECWFWVMVDGMLEMGEPGSRMKSSGPFVDRGLKRGISLWA